MAGEDKFKKSVLCHTPLWFKLKLSIVKINVLSKENIHYIKQKKY